MESDVGMGIGGRGRVWLVLTTVIVAIEQDRVLKCIALPEVCVCV